MSEIQPSRNNSTQLPRLGRNSPTLAYFCVYNPTLSQSEENTKDQILYYTAKKVVPADIKMKQIGLAQALVNFTSTFSPFHSTQNVHSQKNRMIFLQPEPDFWMHMCIELGVIRKQVKDSKGKEKLGTEYLDTQLNDIALEAVLKVGYEQFKLLNGTFTSILYGDGTDKPNRQRSRHLMMAVEEFFSEWIWKWDFDRLDTMCFNAVFNGVPIQPVPRHLDMKMVELDKSVQKRFTHLLQHLFVLDSNEGSLVYHSPSLAIKDVCALRKYSLKRVEKYVNAEKRKQDMELMALKKESKVSGIKSFTQTHILNYFTSGSKSTETTSSNRSVDSISIPSNTSTTDINTNTTNTNANATKITTSQGVFLTGLVESMAIGMNGEERPVTKCDLVRVYISSPYDDDIPQGLSEYYLLVYKHKSNLVWNFLLSATNESKDLISDITFYNELEIYLLEEGMEALTDSFISNACALEEKSRILAKSYKCFYYDTSSLNMKSTLHLKNSKDTKTNFNINNDILLQLLEVKDDFDKIALSSEVYTKSTANHWVTGRRIYNVLAIERMKENEAKEDEFEQNVLAEEYTEIYLIAAKKDITLAEIEETLGKMTISLLETIHADS
ncbi:hypothetical protein BDB01DRAFT_794065 [Pilobolus umbonatus]|nr:hypothetical protein BDB01DRAFT_794065 [Pilobolus umbonatus]